MGRSTTCALTHSDSPALRKHKQELARGTHSSLLAEPDRLLQEIDRRTQNISTSRRMDFLVNFPALTATVVPVLLTGIPCCCIMVFLMLPLTFKIIRKL